MKRMIALTLAVLMLLLPLSSATAATDYNIVVTDGICSVYKGDTLEYEVYTGPLPVITLTRDSKSRVVAAFADSLGNQVDKVTFAKCNVTVSGEVGGIDLLEKYNKSTLILNPGSYCGWLKIASRGNASVYQGSIGTVELNNRKCTFKVAEGSTVSSFNIYAGTGSIYGNVNSLVVSGKKSKAIIQAGAVVSARQKTNSGVITAGEGRQPEILIYQTHTDESYTATKKYSYDDSGWRSKDPKRNVILVGQSLADQLEAYGYVVIHDATDHSPNSYAYNRSEVTMQAYKNSYPSIQMFIDVHRDAGSSRSYVDVDGKECARMMFVIGKGVGFIPAPDYESNNALASSIMTDLNSLYPGLMRSMPDKTNRYNQHMSSKCLLVEVGDNYNYMEDALNATVPLAAGIARHAGL